MDNTSELQSINKTLDKIRQSLETVARSVEKPKENKFVRAMELIVLFGGISIFLTAADIIRNWIMGG